MISQMGEFLRAVLPEQGIKIAAIVRGSKAPQHVFVASYDDLENVLSTQDALGHTVYHACASFKTSDNRKGENALGAKAFWLDVDAGLGKPYEDAQTAFEAVEAFRARVGLPPPLYVGSGRGLHVYWPLEGIVDAAIWKHHAQGLKELCALHGLEVDPTRVADLASILRTPGTHWRKENPPRLVQAGTIPHAYALDLFGGLLAAAPPMRTPRPKIPATGLAATLLDSLQPESPPADEVAQACGQVRALRDRQGSVSEPHWFAVAGALQFCADGLEKALAWSSGGFEPQIRDKFQRSEKLSGPTTCRHFHDNVDRATCEACPLFQHITTPLQAPRMVLPAASPLPVFTDEAEDAETAPELPTLYPPWAWSAADESLVFKTEGKSGVEVNQTVARYPIYLAGVQTGEANGTRYSYVLKQRLPNKGWIDISLGAGKLIGANGIAEIFDQGAVVQDKDLFRKYIVTQIENYHAAQDIQMKYDQFGWKEEDTSFLCGKRLYRGMAAPTIVTGADEVNLRAQWLGARPGADLRAWQQAANVFFAKGNEPQAVALLAGFAAPLMRFHATDEGGAVLSLVSARSGTGKTTALAAAASIYGQMDALNLTNIDTRVSKAITFGTLGNLPVIHDELSNRDPEVLKEFIVVFTNGRDKMRGTQDGGIRHTAARWQTLMLAASNQSIVDLIQSTSIVDAPAYRVLELPVNVPQGRNAASGDMLRRALERNAGVAGDQFLHYITRDTLPGILRNQLAKITDEIWSKTALETQHRFWVRAASTIALAAQVTERMGLLEFSAERIIDWLLEQLVHGRSEASSFSDQRLPAVGALSEYLAEHFGNTLVVSHAYQPKKPTTIYVRPIHRLLIRYEVESRKLYISEKMFREWLTKKGHGSRQTVRELTDASIVTQSRRYITLSAGTDFPGGQMACLEINVQHPMLSGMLAPLDAIEKNA